MPDVDRVEPVKHVDRIVRRKEQIAVALRHIENEKQAVERKMLSMDRDARARRLVLLGYLINRYVRHLDRLERVLGRSEAPVQGSTSGQTLV
jgi:hypothetical protein